MPVMEDVSSHERMNPEAKNPEAKHVPLRNLDYSRPNLDEP